MSYLGVPDVVVTVLAYLHIISAMAWLGAAILFVSTLAPATKLLSRSAYLEYLATVTPRMSRFFFMVATSAVVFGVALLLTIPDFSPYIGVGIATGAAAYIAMLADVRTAAKVSHIAGEMVKGGQTGFPSAELARELRMIRIGTVSTVVLLVVTLMFMVYSGYPF